MLCPAASQSSWARLPFTHLMLLPRQVCVSTLCAVIDRLASCRHSGQGCLSPSQIQFEESLYPGPRYRTNRTLLGRRRLEAPRSAPHRRTQLPSPPPSDSEAPHVPFRHPPAPRSISFRQHCRSSFYSAPCKYGPRVDCEGVSIVNCVYIVPQFRTTYFPQACKICITRLKAAARLPIAIGSAGTFQIRQC